MRIDMDVPGEAAVVANLDLIERLLRQTCLHRNRLADEYRSIAGWAMARAAPRVAGMQDPRPFLARCILRAFSKLRRDLSVPLRNWAPLGPALDAGFHPTSREVAPEVMASLREEYDLDALAASPPAWPSPTARRLSPGARAVLASLIRDNPSWNDKRVAREFAVRARESTSVPTVRRCRIALGIPNPYGPGNRPKRAYLHSRRDASS